MRLLEIAKAAIRQSQSLARVAAQAEFAGQSHLTRQFKPTYDLTPARWARLTCNANGSSAAIQTDL
jgi:AraC-like DNA-binding protein